MVNPPITTTAVLGMPPAQAGVAAAVASTSRQVGQTLGVALAGAIAATALGAVGPGFVASSHAAWWVVTGCGVAVLRSGCSARPRGRTPPRGGSPSISMRKRPPIPTPRS